VAVPLTGDASAAAKSGVARPVIRLGRGLRVRAARRGLRLPRPACSARRSPATRITGARRAWS